MKNNSSKITQGYNSILSSYGRRKREIFEKIVDCLNKHPEGAQPKTISYETSIKHNTIKGFLRGFLRS